jgi:hypothetical protein
LPTAAYSDARITSQKPGSAPTMLLIKERLLGLAYVILLILRVAHALHA